MEGTPGKVTDNAGKSLRTDPVSGSGAGGRVRTPDDQRNEATGDEQDEE